MQLFGFLVGFASSRLQWIERTNVLDMPADRHHVTDPQGAVELGDRLLDEEIVDPADLEADADVVVLNEEVDENDWRTLVVEQVWKFGQKVFDKEKDLE